MKKNSEKQEKINRYCMTETGVLMERERGLGGETELETQMVARHLQKQPACPKVTQLDVVTGYNFQFPLRRR